MSKSEKMVRLRFVPAPADEEGRVCLDVYLDDVFQYTRSFPSQKAADAFIDDAVRRSQTAQSDEEAGKWRWEVSPVDLNGKVHVYAYFNDRLQDYQVFPTKAAAEVFLADLLASRPGATVTKQQSN